MRKSSRGNPWHDARGRFAHGPSGGTYWRNNEIPVQGVIKSEQSAEEYERQTEMRFARRSKEMVDELKSKEKISKEEIQEYVEHLKKEHPEYAEALKECDRRADLYNEVARPLGSTMVEYNRAIDEGRNPNVDYDQICEQSALARKRYEEYREADKQAEKYEGDLRELNAKYAEQEGKSPQFYTGTIPRKSMAMVTMPYQHAVKGFDDTVTDRNSKEYQMALSEASALRGEDKADTERRFNEILGDKEHTPENYGKAFKTLYKEKQGELLSLDLETNSLSPARGNIIEFGCVDSQGNEFNVLYSPTKSQLDANGVGLTEIHNISEDMVAGKKTFESDSQNILGMMKGKTILVHNKGFELNWFRQQIPGFAEAEVNGEIKVVDTMHICQKFCQTKRNRLMDFVEFTGGKYENAHRSSADAKMTLSALMRWLNG